VLKNVPEVAGKLTPFSGMQNFAQIRNEWGFV